MSGPGHDRRVDGQNRFGWQQVRNRQENRRAARGHDGSSQIFLVKGLAIGITEKSVLPGRSDAFSR